LRVFVGGDSLEKKRVTLKDIADRAGVSVGAVSQVLRGAQSTIRVSEVTAKKIRIAAHDLEYNPVSSLQNLLHRRKKKSIALISYDQVSIVKNAPFVTAIFEQLSTHSQNAEFELNLELSGCEGQDEAILIDKLTSYSGLIWIGTPPPKSLTDKLQSKETQSLHIQPNASSHLVTVGVNLSNVLCQLVTRLRNNGHKNILAASLSPKSSVGTLSNSRLGEISTEFEIDYTSYQNIRSLITKIQNSALPSALLIWEFGEALFVRAELQDAGIGHIDVYGFEAGTERNERINPIVYPFAEVASIAMSNLMQLIADPAALIKSVCVPVDDLQFKPVNA
jgi:DNA-binding LacI/PurR family transcriptional regulator